MNSLNFWLHMDEYFMWRWYCYDQNRVLVVRSSDAYFDHEEAEAAVKSAKARMIQAAAA